MAQKWIHILVILAFYQKITSGAGKDVAVKEGHQVEIRCTPTERGSMTIWFRVLDKSGMEFIASFSNAGVQKPNTKTPSSTFSYAKITQDTIILQSFREAADSGVYSCATLHRGTELKFGEVTRLVADKEKAAETTSTPIDNKQSRCTEAPRCDCGNSNPKAEPSPSMFCTPLILGPLAAAAAFFFYSSSSPPCTATK